jgi:hypothetical protein
VADKINIFRCMYIYVSVGAGSVISKKTACSSKVVFIIASIALE